VTVSLDARHTRAMLLDIEGTTTPVDFVYQVLFPYARAHVADYLARTDDSPARRDALALLRSEFDADRAARAPHVAPDAPGGGGPAAIAQYVQQLIDRDCKTTGLKALQGLIWQDGYARGELQGQVYADVPPAFERWRARGLRIFIYSSGSVLAQRLLFGSLPSGDLTPFISGYFDTGAGPKRAPASYAAIAARAGIPPEEILFVSDVLEELDAAKASGIQTALCVRAGDAAGRTADRHPVVHTFDEIA
jgi:enolase-phosphatase E1